MRRALPILSLVLVGCHLIFPHHAGSVDRGSSDGASLDGAARDRGRSDAPLVDLRATDAAGDQRSSVDRKPPAPDKKSSDQKPTADVKQFDLKLDKDSLKPDQKPWPDASLPCGVTLDSYSSKGATGTVTLNVAPNEPKANLLLVHVASYGAISVTVKLGSTGLTPLCQQASNSLLVGIFALEVPGGVPQGVVSVVPNLTTAPVIAVSSTWVNSKLGAATLCAAPSFSSSTTPTITATVGAPACRVADLAVIKAPVYLSAASGQFVFGSATTGGISVGVGERAVTGGSTTTSSWTSSVDAPWGMAAAVLRPGP